jgi:hypothetical protein
MWGELQGSPDLQELATVLGQLQSRLQYMLQFSMSCSEASSMQYIKLDVYWTMRVCLRLSKNTFLTIWKSAAIPWWKMREKKITAGCSGTLYENYST